LTAYPDADPETNTVDGPTSHQLALGSGASWATVKAGAGTNASPSSTVNGFWMASDNVSNQWRELSRVAFLFDTSKLTAGAVKSSAILSLYGHEIYDDLGSAPSLDIYTSSPASNTDLVGTDFPLFGTTSQTGSPKAWASLVINDWNNWVLNGTGIANISNTSISKFGIRDATYDVGSSTPTWSSNAFTSIDFRLADQTGTANDPKLVVTYTSLAAVTGTATESITEADIVTGSKTIIITIDGDTFIA